MVTEIFPGEGWRVPIQHASSMKYHEVLLQEPSYARYTSELCILFLLLHLRGNFSGQSKERAQVQQPGRRAAVKGHPKISRGTEQQKTGHLGIYVKCAQTKPNYDYSSESTHRMFREQNEERCYPDLLTFSPPLLIY